MELCYGAAVAERSHAVSCQVPLLGCTISAGCWRDGFDVKRLNKLQIDQLMKTGFSSSLYESRPIEYLTT
jgi:hypothetical protein